MRLIGEDDALFEQFRSILNDAYISWEVLSYQVDQADLNGETTLTVTLRHANKENPITLSGTGEGVIDAFFRMMLKDFSAEYQSLKTISFVGFSVGSDISDKSSNAGADSSAEVQLTIENSYGKKFTFSHAHRSVITASLFVTSAVIEFFINSELAYITMHRALKYSQENHRTEMVAQYKASLIKLVKNTSYSEILESIQNDA